MPTHVAWVEEHIHQASDHRRLLNLGFPPRRISWRRATTCQRPTRPPRRSHGIPNVGNTCFMNALLQCCRQLLLRVPSHLLPESQECPLARALQAQPFSESDVEQWPCWTFLPTGQQRDACEVLEICWDPKSPLHTSCDHAVCDGALLQNLTVHKLERHLQCKHCAYVGEKVQ